MTHFKCMICGKVDELDKSINDPRYGLVCDNCHKEVDDRPVKFPPSENTCVCCGEVIPEGRQVCLKCQKETHERSYREQLKLDGWTEYHPAVYTVDERDSNPVDIHKIIDDAMEKRNRTVSIFIRDGDAHITINPYEDEKVYWIRRTDGDYCDFQCSNCERFSLNAFTYCPKCGELTHGIRNRIDMNAILKKFYDRKDEGDENKT